MFGRERGGNMEVLRRIGDAAGFIVTGIADVADAAAAISSTRIRNALLEGDVASANALLGRAYAMDGLIAKGDRMGRKIGFPTMNLQPDNELYPKDGVYFTSVRIESFERTFPCVTNIGRRPTVYEDFATTIESLHPRLLVGRLRRARAPVLLRPRARRADVSVPAGPHGADQTRRGGDAPLLPRRTRCHERRDPGQGRCRRSRPRSREPVFESGRGFRHGRPRGIRRLRSADRGPACPRLGRAPGGVSRRARRARSRAHVVADRRGRPHGGRAGRRRRRLRRRGRGTATPRMAGARPRRHRPGRRVGVLGGGHACERGGRLERRSRLDGRRARPSRPRRRVRGPLRRGSAPPRAPRRGRGARRGRPRLDPGAPRRARARLA